MKALLYLMGLIAACICVIWLVFGVTPDQQLNKAGTYLKGTSSKISSHLADTTSSASKLKNRLNSELDQAADVYHGKEKEDPYKYNKQQ